MTDHHDLAARIERADGPAIMALKNPDEALLKAVQYVLFCRMMEAMNVPLSDHYRRCQIKAAIQVCLPQALYAAGNVIEERAQVQP